MAPIIRIIVRQQMKKLEARVSRLERRGRIWAMLSAAAAGLVALIAKWRIES